MNLILTIKTSLIICFFYSAMKEGQILFFLRQFYEWALSFLPEKVNLYLRKPLFDCLQCMSSVYGITFTLKYFDISFEYLFLILQIGGLNYLIASGLRWLHDQAEKMEPYHEEILKDEKEAVK